MCGIVAVRGATDDRLVREMMARMQHRGPDGEGIARVGDVLLGHVRLAIVDVERGRQPLFNEDEDVAVSLNGEIYNHLALRESLRPGHRFRTQCDAEAVVHLYEEVGEDAVSSLDGMFAFALAGRDGLLLARDSIGIKPLYYGTMGGAFVAASEIKAFPEGTRDLRALPAGHLLRAGGTPRRFSLPIVRAPEVAMPEDDVRIEILRRLEQAVTKRLMADVPVGVFLSGGLDSSIVAALMRRHLPHLHSFAAGVEGSPDLAAARHVAAFLGTEHHEVVYTADDVWAVLPEVIWHLESFDAPLVRSAVPCWFVSRLAAAHVKVVLTGEGADELFAGYSYLAGLEGGDALRDELDGVIDRLQDTNLQRTDRMTMAHGIEGRVPFLDLDLIRFVSRLPVGLIEPRPGRPEKWLLREACRGLLPRDIVDRPKMKFSEGAGSAGIVAGRLAGGIDQGVFEEEKEIAPGLTARSPEELLYYSIWRDEMGDAISPSLVGRTRDRTAAAQESP